MYVLYKPKILCQIEAYRTGYQTIPTILKRNELSNFSRLLNASARITFWMLHVRTNFVFRLFNVSHSFRGHSANKTCLRFAILNFSEKLQNILEIGLQKYGVFVQESISLKNISKEKIHRQVCSKLSSSFLQCPLQVKKLIRENSAKYVNQTGNFYFQPKLKKAISLPIFNLFQWFLFCIRDFIWIITFTKKSKFEENRRSEGIL